MCPYPNYSTVTWQLNNHLSVVKNQTTGWYFLKKEDKEI